MNTPSSGPPSGAARLRALYQVPLVVLWLVLWYFPLILFTVLTLGRFTPALIHRYARIWGRVSLALVSVRIEVEGQEHAMTREPRILLFNHASILDLFLVTAVLPPAGIPLAKAEFRSYPVIGWLWQVLGVIFLERSDPERARASVDRAAQLVASGRRTIVVAPEGTRSPTGELLPFKKGAFHIALATRAPIVPLVIHGAHRLQPKGALHVRPGVVRVRFLSPIPTEAWTREELDARIDEVRGMYVRELERLDRGPTPVSP